jgi:hypothetical protein
MDSRVEFSDLRGRKYVYSVRKFEDFWADVPGNYIFAKRTRSCTHKGIPFGSQV